MLNVSSGIVDNCIIWDGDKNTWSPPDGYDTLESDVTPAMTWVFSESKCDYELKSLVGAGQIGFFMSDGVLTTNLPKPHVDPDSITSRTISLSVACIQSVAYLTTDEMGQHITPESRQEVTDYIHAVANILATAQQKYGTGEAYAPTFPPAPTALPGKPKADGAEEAPFIKFIVVE